MRSSIFIVLNELSEVFLQGFKGAASVPGTDAAPLKPVERHVGNLPKDRLSLPRIL